jgi:hypothetical protein
MYRREKKRGELEKEWMGVGVGWGRTRRKRDTLGDEVRVGETFDVITVARKRRKKKVGGGCKAMVMVVGGGYRRQKEGGRGIN